MAVTPISRSDSRIIYAVYPDRSFNVAPGHSYALAMTYPPPPLSTVSETGLPAITDDLSPLIKQDDPLNGSRRAFRHFIRGTWPTWGSNYLAPGLIPTVRRSEIIISNGDFTNSIMMGGEYVIGFAVCLHQDTMLCNRGITVFEIGEPDPLPGQRVHNGPGQVALMTTGYSGWDVYYGGDTITNGNFTNNGWFPNLRYKTINGYGVALWQYFVFHINHVADNTGFVRLYNANETNDLSDDLVAYSGPVGCNYDVTVASTNLRPLRFGLFDQFPLATSSPSDTLTLHTKGCVVARVVGTMDPTLPGGVLGLLRTI